MYWLNKLYLLIEKQHNRGQDGAGLVSLKIYYTPGKEFLDLYRSAKENPIQNIFEHIRNLYQMVEEKNTEHLSDAQWAKKNLPFSRETYLSHLRYGTFGRNA
ncbi:MAG TPA: hypothetical protein PKJ43_06415 [Prolixibacteraceae bacterium]|nr:hypothetical protein [Prolixibacteraceae bacterium]